MTHKFGKYLILAVGAMGLTALPTFALTCVNTMDMGALYTNTDGSSNGFSCSLDNGNIVLSNFTYSAPGTNTPATAVGVEVDNPGVDGFGLDFTGNWMSTGTTNTDVDVKFDVTALNGVSINDIYIVLGASSFTGTGSALYEETYCTGPPNEPCFEQVENPGPAQTDVVTLNSPTTTLTITKDVHLTPGSNGTVSVSSFGNQYSTVPEPRAVSLLLGLGLLAGLAIFKRRQVTQN